MAWSKSLDPNELQQEWRREGTCNVHVGGCEKEKAADWKTVWTLDRILNIFITARVVSVHRVWGKQNRISKVDQEHYK